MFIRIAFSFGPKVQHLKIKCYKAVMLLPYFYTHLKPFFEIILFVAGRVAILIFLLCFSFFLCCIPGAHCSPLIPGGNLLLVNYKITTGMMLTSTSPSLKAMKVQRGVRCSWRQCVSAQVSGSLSWRAPACSEPQGCSAFNSSAENLSSSQSIK